MPKGVNIKDTTIEESQDVSTMKDVEQISPLLVFKIEIDEKSEKKSKGVAFKVDTKGCNNQIEHDVNENLTKSNAMLVKSFNKVMRRVSKRSKNNVSTNFKHNQHDNLKRWKLSA